MSSDSSKVVLACVFAVLSASGARAQVVDTAYFQQGVDYRIEARLDEDTDVLSGRARLRYTNRSSARIDTLWFHLHLNAFRPNSAWAQRDLEISERRFQDLGPDQHAFERLKSVQVAGQRITPVFPGTPDSTVVGIPLPSSLTPGQSETVLIDWDARLSIRPRRQGRRDRHFDFAQWYPRIAVFDRGGWQVQPLLPQGEFYGEFASYDVTLDVPADQVIGATGVPVEGDPGWQKARAPGSSEPQLKRDSYPARPAENLELLVGPPAADRKRVRWRAENVHHFAWSTNPRYIYEGGAFENVAIHVLYQPGDTAWDDGVAVRRTITALAFLDTIFGKYPWPQLTNVHRIEGGGTEFPMMIMDGSASEGLILHETAHQYVHGILANNEWRQGWLDEGFASFLGSWYAELRGANPRNVWVPTLQGMRMLEQAGATQRISMKSADFRDFDTYNAMTYTKPAIVYRMLRYVMGEEDFRKALRHYFQQNMLRHVREEDFKASAEAFHPDDLDWFFEQWIHTTETLDYRLGEVTSSQAADGTWQTRVEVIREGGIWMPVELRVGGETRLLESRERRQIVTVTTRERPTVILLDPDEILLDVNPDNNRRSS
jgi:hypothetical protein